MQEEIEMMEATRRRAMVAGDVASLDALLDEHVTYVHSNGLREDKAAYLHMVRNGVYTYVDVSQPEMAIRSLGDVALVTGRIVLRVKRADGTVKTVDGRSVVVWARRDGAWRMLHYQGTSVPA